MLNIFYTVKTTELPPVWTGLLTLLITCNFVVCYDRLSIFPFDVGVGFGFDSASFCSVFTNFNLLILQYIS